MNDRQAELLLKALVLICVTIFGAYCISQGLDGMVVVSVGAVLAWIAKGIFDAPKNQ